jgi:TolB-like protein/DNA-binding winged helix-turn-helix (wHTH) protein/Flp pilus assembly protein TadD
VSKLWGALTASEFHFGNFTLDQSRFRLQRGERRVHVEKLPMELLILLVQRQGELVTRGEIAERLWGNDVFLDVDHSINVAVRKIRVALRDDPDRPRFVETIVGKGYRFAAPVTSNNGVSSGQVQPAIQVDSDKGTLPANAETSPFKVRILSRNVALLLVAVATLAVIGLSWLFHRGIARVATQPPIKSLAVLPLKNLSADPTQQYLADGLTEDLIGRLALVPGLHVISRTSSMHFKDSQLSIPEIAKALRVDAIVEGSVIREDSQIRVHAQLIRAATDEHIWAGEYEREYGSVLVLQQEVVGNIVARIEASLTPRSRVGRTRAVDPEAYEAYLKGRYYFNQRTVEALNKSTEYFQQAIGKDPSYALAYSGLADTYALLGFRGRVRSKDALLRAKAAALKAIELEDALSDPHASLAFIAETHEWDWVTAEREYKRALELNPDDARANHWYAGYLTYVGRVDEGIVKEMRARELDPLSLPINNALAGRLLVAGRYDEALQQVQKTLELDSHFPQAHQTLGWVYLSAGKQEEAVREFQNALQLSGADDTDLILDLGFAYAATGHRDEARTILAKLKALHQQGLATSASVGILYGALGESDEAFSWLEKAHRERDPELTYIKVGRRFEPLRHDPRFEKLVRRIGLPD